MAPGESRPPRRMPLALATVALVAVVLVVVVALLAARLTSGSSGSGPPPTPGAPGGVAADATGVPAATLDAVGAPGPPEVAAPATVGDTTTLRQGGLPVVVWVGAEFCPFCAAERWSLVVALSRFGRFANLGVATSSKQLVFPGLASLSFRGATYHSSWVALQAVETYSASGPSSDPTAFAPLQGVPSALAGQVHRYDVPPLAPATGSLPFVDVAGRSVVVGAQFSPAVLTGKSLGAVAAALADATSPVAQAVDGAANELAAAICDATGQMPADVCRSAGVRAGAARLPAPAPPRPGA